MASNTNHEWLKPTEKWSDHDDPHLAEALAFAQARGWFFRPSTDHGFGTIKCTHPAPLGQTCRVPVNKTPKNPWARAKDLMRQVRHCPHQSGRSPLSKAYDLVEKAENLSKAAGALLDHEHHLDRATEKYALAQDLIDEVEADTALIAGLMRDAGELEDTAAAARTEAESLDEDVRKDDTASSVFDAADRAAGLARREVLGLDPSQAQKTLKQRLSVVKAQLNELRIRLSER